MTAAVERLVNLALFFADNPGSITAVDIRESVAGYPPGADEGAFKRMLERDKEVLRAAGLVIDSDDEGNYRLDRAATYAAPVTLAPEEAAAVRAAGIALLGDASFPFAEDLRLALTKISAEIEGPPLPATALLADEEPQRQGTLVAELSSAASRQKLARFGYTNSLGKSAPHEVEPYGLFLHDGRWYLVARDTAKAEVRTYTVSRIEDLAVNASAPKTPDFDRPADFDVASFIRLPFQYGPDSSEFSARILFDPSATWRAAGLSGGQGTLEAQGDVLVWTVRARSAERLLRFVIEHGPGLRVLEPAALRPMMEEAFAILERAHG